MPLNPLALLIIIGMQQPPIAFPYIPQLHPHLYDERNNFDHLHKGLNNKHYLKKTARIQQPRGKGRR